MSRKFLHDLLRPHTAAHLLDVSNQFIDEAIRSGKLAYFEIEQKIWIDPIRHLQPFLNQFEKDAKYERT